jgi:hypothetical protein
MEDKERTEKEHTEQPVSPGDVLTETGDDPQRAGSDDQSKKTCDASSELAGEVSTGDDYV